MRKIVYNACFGGFGLSHEAVKRYGELKGLNLIFIKEKDFYLGLDDDDDYIFGSWYRDGIKDDEHYFSTYDFERDDPILVQVVEELGDRANGEHARLRIAQVMEGTRYRIDEYDGNETVMTVDDYDWNIA